MQLTKLIRLIMIDKCVIIQFRNDYLKTKSEIIFFHI